MSEIREIILEDSIVGENLFEEFAKLSISETKFTIAPKREVQKHGFSWEKDILTNVYGATEEELRKIRYTSAFDLPAELNHIDGSHLSIKTTSNPNAVCMADCLRLFDASLRDEPFHLVVIHYEQDDERGVKRVKWIVEVDLTRSNRILFGDICREEIQELMNAVRAVPQKRRPTKEEYDRMYQIRDRLQPRSAAIHLDIKCNSTQSRLQCSFNHFERFLAENAERVVARSGDNPSQFRGGSILPEIKSSRRTFTKKIEKQIEIEKQKDL